MEFDFWINVEQSCETASTYISTFDTNVPTTHQNRMKIDAVQVEPLDAIQVAATAGTSPRRNKMIES